MKYLHTMVRVTDIDESLDFYCRQLGLRELRRWDDDAGRYTLVFLAAQGPMRVLIPRWRFRGGRVVGRD